MPSTLVAFGVMELGLDLAVATFLANGAISFALSFVVSRVFGQEPPTQQDNGVRQQIPPSTTNGVPIAYGSTYLGGTFVDAVLSTDQKTMYYVLAISSYADGSDFSYDTSDFYYGDRLITFDSTDRTKVVSLTDEAGNVDTTISGNLYINLYKSSYAGVITPYFGASAPNVVMGGADIDAAQRWPSSGRQMNGLIFAIVKLNYSREAQTTQLQPITFHIKQFSPGLDRARPGDVWYDYMTNKYYGCAVDASFVSTDTRDALNTYSDQLITFTNSSGSPATQRRYTINGVLNAGETALNNVDKILMACDSWMAYDATTGKWSIVINKAESAAYSFDDNNIIGEVRVSAIDITNSVNQIEAKFPYKGNRDMPSYVNISTPSALLYPNEPVNKSSISFDMVNDSVQTTYLANRILEQAREDLIVSFSTTHYGIQVNAGDVISVTNSAYGWSNKLFRAMKINETVLPDGTLGARIEANEYNAAVYDDADIKQFTPVPNSGLASPAYFSPLSAPTVTGFPTASIPYFNVTVTIPSIGRVTWGTLYYTTSATPTSSDWLVLTTAESTNSQPVANGSTYVFKNQILSAGTYYFAFVVGNDISQSQLSSVSSSFVWSPIGMVGPTGPTGTLGPTGPTGSSVTGATGPRSASGYIYYGTASATAPAAPTASGFDFTNGTFSTLTSGWSTTFTAPAPVTNPSTQAGSKFWAVRYAVSEATYGGTQTVTLTSVFNWQNLDGLVTFTNVVAPSGTTFIDGGNIITDTLTVSTIKNKTSGTYGTGGNYVTFGLGLNISLGSYPAGGTFSSSNSGYFGAIATNTAGGNAIGAGTTSTSSVGAAVVGVGAGTSTFAAYKNLGALGVGDSGGSFQTNGSGYLNAGTSADIRLAYYTGGTSYAYYVYSGAAYPFTAGHDAMQLLTESIPEVGDLMVDVALIAADSVNDTITQMSVSSSANQKGVIGVFTGVAGEGFVPSALSEYVEAPDGTKTQVQLKPEYANIYDTYRCIGVNAIGEGKMNVCGQGGDIEIGDFIVASDMPGKGMKQADDVFHSYTVAKARENVTFSSPTEVQSIAIIYMGG